MRTWIARTSEFCLVLATLGWAITVQFGVATFAGPMIWETFRCPMEGVGYLEVAYLHVPPLDNQSEDFHPPTGKGATR